MATVHIEELYLQCIASFSLNNPSAAFQPSKTQLKQKYRQDKRKQLIMQTCMAGLIVIRARLFYLMHLLLQKTPEILWIRFSGTAFLFWKTQVGMKVILQLHLKPLLYQSFWFKIPAMDICFILFSTDAAVRNSVRICRSWSWCLGEHWET